MMNYKGYIGAIRVDLDAAVIRGTVVNTRDTITFQGKSVEEVKAAFRDSVQDYLEFCASTGDTPEKPYSGKFVVRVQPEVHRELSALAQARGISLNSLVLRQLSRMAKSAKSGRRKKPASNTGAASPSTTRTSKRDVEGVRPRPPESMTRKKDEAPG
jgi:predicted HicB family RNase H-like nuclease